MKFNIRLKERNAKKNYARKKNDRYNRYIIN